MKKSQGSYALSCNLSLIRSAVGFYACVCSANLLPYIAFMRVGNAILCM